MRQPPSLLNSIGPLELIIATPHSATARGLHRAGRRIAAAVDAPSLARKPASGSFPSKREISAPAEKVDI
eukprot:scaffold168766_cov32-Tisochrysis_lutea.AAC.1